MSTARTSRSDHFAFFATGIGRSFDRDDVPAGPSGLAEATVRVVPFGAALPAAFRAGALGEVAVSVLNG